MRLRYARTAIRQIDQVLDDVKRQSPAGAERLRDRILTFVEILQEYPSAGHMTTRPGVRRIVITPFPYLLFYRVLGDEVVVQRLRHAARKRPASDQVR